MNTNKAIAAEWVGTAALLATVIGSGIMAERLIRLLASLRSMRQHLYWRSVLGR